MNVVLIGDGDVSAALSGDAIEEIDMLMGIGAAQRGNNSHCVESFRRSIRGATCVQNEGHRERAEAMIDGDIERLWGRDELCASEMQYSLGLEFVQVEPSGLRNCQMVVFQSNQR